MSRRRQFVVFFSTTFIAMLLISIHVRTDVSILLIFGLFYFGATKDRNND